MVANYLHEKNFGMLLFDLLIEEEGENYYKRFEIGLFIRRLAGAVERLERLPAAKDCRIGYFGISTGTTSVLKAAAILLLTKCVVVK